jgi:hypothetical protein
MAEEQAEEDSEQKVDEEGGGQLVVKEVEVVGEEAEAVGVPAQEEGISAVGLEVELLEKGRVDVVESSAG